MSSFELYKTTVQARTTSQSEPILGSDQVKNNAGGYVFQVTHQTRAIRFLILGSEKGTYYVEDKKLTKDNANCIIELAKNKDTANWLLDQIVDISESGRAMKNDPALLALALICTYSDIATKRRAMELLPRVARIGTHLQHFVAFIDGLRGWGEIPAKGVSNWFNEKAARDLAYQVIKYQTRDGWSMRDVLRVAHPKPVTPLHNDIYAYIVKQTVPENNDELALLHAYEQAKATTDEDEMCGLIRKFNLSHEMVKSDFKNSKNIWIALLEKMPMTALIRNLPTLTKLGVLEDERLVRVTDFLTNENALHKARVHPLQVLMAMETYDGGHSLKGSSTWQPIKEITAALDKAFYLSFKNVVPTGKRILLALDVSGSMSSHINGTSISCRTASAAMAMITARTEANWEIVGFTSSLSNRDRWNPTLNGICPLAITSAQSLTDITNYIDDLPFGGTDCALPMLWATNLKKEFDAFVIYTDSETWAGSVHPVQALKVYRDNMGIQAKLVVVGMTATDFSIADPKDRDMLDVVGFDTNAPVIMNDFIKNGI